MNRRRFFFMCLAAVAAMAFAGSRAQGAAWQYQIKVNGQPVSVEKGTVSESGETIAYMGEMTRTLPQAMTLSSTLTISATTRRPLSYSMTAQSSGGQQKLSVTFDGNKAAYRAEQPAGVQSGELRLHDGFIVWENNIWVQLTYLIRAFYGGGGNQYYVLVPTMMREFSVLIEDRGLEKVGSEGAEQPTRHLTIHFGETPAIDVWAEPESGLPVQVRIAAQRVEVTRVGVTP